LWIRPGLWDSTGSSKFLSLNSAVFSESDEFFPPDVITAAVRR